MAPPRAPAPLVLLAVGLLAATALLSLPGVLSLDPHPEEKQAILQLSSPCDDVACPYYTDCQVNTKGVPMCVCTNRKYYNGATHTCDRSIPHTATMSVALYSKTKARGVPTIVRVPNVFATELDGCVPIPPMKIKSYQVVFIPPDSLKGPCHNIYVHTKSDCSDKGLEFPGYPAHQVNKTRLKFPGAALSCTVLK